MTLYRMSNQMSNDTFSW